MSENNETTKMENYSNMMFTNTTYSNADDILNKQFLLKVDDERLLLKHNIELHSPCYTQITSRLPPPPPPLPPPPQISSSNTSLTMQPMNQHQILYSSILHNTQPPEYEHRYNLETPPNSASCSTTPESKSNERLSSLTRSQPDLSKLNDDLNALIKRKTDETLLNTQYWFPGTPIDTCLASNCMGPANGMTVCSTYGENLIDYLRKENNSLRLELDCCFGKISKLQKMEIDLQKIHQAHDDLMISSEKKEKLERTVRYKLEIELKRLQQQNKTLKEQMNAALSTIAATRKMNDNCLDGNDIRNEIQKRDVLIAQLLSQNKELINEKERHEIELQAQRLTLEEQRNHIDTLDSALMSAQSNVVKLETEIRKQVCYEEKAKNLQKALINLQMASERRLKIEKRARNNLEKEIEELKQRLNEKNEINSNGDENGNKYSDDSSKSDCNSNVNYSNGNSGASGNHSLNSNIDNATSLMKQEIEELRSLNREYEEKIINLESEVTKWEQKYLEESTMRTIEVDAASVPKDAKIAALEKTSQESEKLILQARNERLKHMDELHLAHKKCAELEGKIRDQESKLAERDAMIKVLQQHSRDKAETLQKSLLAHRSTSSTVSSIENKISPIKHMRSASTMGLTNTSVGLRKFHPTITSCENKLDSRNKTNLLNNSQVPKSSTVTSTSLTTNTTVNSATTSKINTYKQEINDNEKSPNIQNNLDEQLKELDIRLMSKDSIIRALRTEKERYPNHYWHI